MTDRRADFPALARYASAIEDFDAMLEALSRPLPRCIWANPMRVAPEALQAQLQQHGVALRPVQWHPWAFIMEEHTQPGTLLEYHQGLYHVQEEVALTAGVALDAQPGERILDLCAAPGNKTVLTAAMMNNEGTLIANEVKAGRLSALRFNLERMGVLNTLVTNLNGFGFPLEHGPFDRVLADVPCSCEGTMRRTPHLARERMPEALRLRTARTQQHLLHRALRLTRPGGTVIYATCTFAPEENEGVLTEVLGDKARIVPFETAGFVGRPGWRQWGDRRFREDVVHARRYLPQDNDTGGFFVARIEVLSPPVRGEDS